MESKKRESRSLPEAFLLPSFLIGVISLLLLGSLHYLLVSHEFEIYIKNHLKKYQRMYSDSIKNDLLTGMDFEVYRKCKGMFNDDEIQQIVVRRPFEEKEICKMSKPAGDLKKIKLSTKVFFDENRENVAAELEIVYSIHFFKILSNQAFYLFIGILMLLIVFQYFLLKKASMKVSESITLLTKKIDEGDIENVNMKDVFAKSKILEVRKVAICIDNLLSNIGDYKKKLIKSARNEAFSEIASQVVHDVRSPLGVLRSITESINDLDDARKNLIKDSVNRISSIANNLLVSNQKKENNTFCLRILVDEIIADKLHETGIAVAFRTNLAYGDTFIYGSEINYYRSLSNLINNSIEAKVIDKPMVSIVLERNSSNLIMTISDEGCGMSKEFLEKVLYEGGTTKEKGNGIGLKSSKKMIEESNGSFEILSEVGIGTKVIIKTESVDKPKWFTDVFLVRSDNVVCIDDDLSYRGLYKSKLSNLGVSLSIYDEEDIGSLSFDESTSYFIDNDLGGGVFGVDLIIEKGIQANSTLVTSMFKNKDLIEKCLEHGVKIFPKQISNEIKIVKRLDKLNKRPELVLIDDDKIICSMWKLEAKNKNVSFCSYSSVEEFINYHKTHDLSTHIYIDSNLGKGLRGEVESEKIYKLGFEKIYIATGYDKDELSQSSWIVEIVGKDFPL